MKRHLKITYYITLIIYLLIFTGLLGFIATAFNSYYWYDDFWLRKELSENSLFNLSFKYYLLWDGRAFSPLYFFRNILLIIFDYNLVYIPIMMSLLVLFISAFFINNTLLHFSNVNPKFSEKILFSIILTFCLWLCYRGHLSHTVYWVTGSFYNYVNLFLLILVYYFFRNDKSIYIIIIYIILTVLSGVNNGILWITFLFFCFAFKISNISRYVFFILLLISFSFLLVNVLAPGNFVRAGSLNNMGFFSIFINFFQVLYSYMLISLWVIIGAILIALIFPYKIKDILLLKLSLIFIFSSLSSIIPFVLIPSFAINRTSIFFQTFLFVGLIFIFRFLFQNFGFNQKPAFVRPIILFFVLYFNYVVFNQFFLGLDVKRQVNDRISILEYNKNKNDTVFINSIFFQKDNFTNRSMEITNDENNHINFAYQLYFNTGKVKIQK